MPDLQDSEVHVPAQRPDVDFFFDQRRAQTSRCHALWGI